MLRQYLAATLAVSTQALPLASSGTQHVLSASSSDGAKVTFSKYKNVYCPAQDELGSGTGNHTRESVKTVADCAATCSDVDVCISFEWEEKTSTCKRSSTCTTFADDGSNAIDFAGVDLYVKDDPSYTPYVGSVCHMSKESKSTLGIQYPEKSDGCSTTPGGGCSILAACAKLCTKEDDCISFAFKEETDRCELSSACTHNSSHANKGGWNLYVKTTEPHADLTHSQVKCGVGCTNEVWNAEAHNTNKDSKYTCGKRIAWRAATEFDHDFRQSCKAVGDKYPVCAACRP